MDSKPKLCPIIPDPEAAFASTTASRMARASNRGHYNVHPPALVNPDSTDGDKGTDKERSV